MIEAVRVVGPVVSTAPRCWTLTPKRTSALDPPANLLLGASYPVGALIAAVGLLFSSGSAVQLAFVVPGAIMARFGWLALPVWPLVLARRVFNKPPSHISNEEGTSPHTQARP